MSVLSTIVRHSIRRRRGLMAASLLVLLGFQLALALAARGLELSGTFTRLRAFIPTIMQPFMDLSALSFGGLVAFGYSHPVVLALLVAMAIAVGTEPAGEVESGFVDLLMARPVSRGQAIQRTVVVLLAATLAEVGVILFGSLAGVALLAPEGADAPSWNVLLSLAASLALLVLAWGGIGLAVASFMTRRVTAAATTALLAFSTFVLDYLGRIWEEAETLARLSPFHYFNPLRLLSGQPPPLVDLVVLGSIFVAGSAIAMSAWSRRDL